MKVIFDIPDRYADIVKGLILAGEDFNDEDTAEIEQAAERIKSSDKPYEVDFESPFLKDEKRELFIAIATVALMQELGNFNLPKTK